MAVPAGRATLYSLLFGFAVGVNVYLWLDSIEERWRLLWSFLAFAVCLGALFKAFSLSARGSMSEQQIKTLGAAE